MAEGAIAFLTLRSYDFSTLNVNQLIAFLVNIAFCLNNLAMSPLNVEYSGSSTFQHLTVT